MTKTIFRVFKWGGIIALFPEEIGTNDPETCLSYMHNGQHGSASVRLVEKTKPANIHQIDALKEELESIGYTVRVVKRFTRKDYQARLNQIR